jgi:fatty acyl-CoA reductase
MLVYNCTSGEVNPLKWGQVETWGHAVTQRYPFNDVLWYPTGAFKSNRYVHEVACVLQHFIPAYLMDAAALVSGKKRIMVRIHKKFSNALKALEYFTTREWNFRQKNVPMLLGELSDVDRQLFNFDMKSLHWYTYLESYFLGARAFVLKEPPSDLPKARRRMKRYFASSPGLRGLVKIVLSTI